MEEISMQHNDQVQRSTTSRRRVRDFFYHLAVYVFILAILFLTSGVSGALVWLSLLWGFAVVMHGIYAYFG
jgi:hypothetical protein